MGLTDVSMVLRRTVWSLSLGAFAFVIADGLWLIVRTPPKELDMWVLSRTFGVVMTAVFISVSSFYLGYITHPFLPTGPFSLIAAYAGLYLSLTVIFFFMDFIGQTSYLWPITLALDYVIVAPVPGVAWFMGFLFQSLVSRSTRRRSDPLSENQSPREG